jgi:hypothetical protein
MNFLPNITRLNGQWVVEAGRLGPVPLVFLCGPDWQDVLDWPGWRKTGGAA